MDNTGDNILIGVNHSARCEKGMMIFLHPWWFLGRCLEIISANQTMFLIYFIKALIPVLWVWCRRRRQQLGWPGRRQGHIVCILHHTWYRQGIFDSLSNLPFWRGLVIRWPTQRNLVLPLLRLWGGRGWWRWEVGFCSRGRDIQGRGTVSFGPRGFWQLC